MAKEAYKFNFDLFTTWSKVLCWTSLLKSMTVEAATLLLMGSCIMTYLLTQDILIQKICRVDLNYEDDVCIGVSQLNSTFAKQEVEIQKFTAEIIIYMQIIECSMAVIYTLILGSLSDSNQRKLPMLLGTCSYIIQPLAMIVCVNIDSLSGLWTGLISSVSKSIFGNDVIFMVAAFSHISDISDESVRTIRTGLLQAFCVLGVPLGFTVGSVTLNAKIGFGASFAISTAMAFSSFLIVLVFVKNSETSPNKFIMSKRASIQYDDNDDYSSNRNFCVRFLLTTKQKFQEFYQVLFKTREDSGRIKLLMLFVVFMLAVGPIGEFGVMYLFLRNRLGWNAGTYGYFSTYNSLCGLAGIVVSIWLLCYLLKLSDPFVGLIGGLSQIGGSIMFAFANTATLMCFASVIHMMSGTIAVVARSMMSKIVLPDEVGKVFSILAVLNSVISLVMLPVYSGFYSATVETFSGSIFILSGVITVPTLIIYLWLICRVRPDMLTKVYEEFPPNKILVEEKSRLLQQSATDGNVKPMDPFGLSFPKYGAA